MAKKTSGRTTDLQALIDRIEALEARIRHLEGDHDAAVAAAADFVLTQQPVPAASPQPAAMPPAGCAEEIGSAHAAKQAPDVPEEVLLVISAAVAAFLGERAHVRQVRLLHSDAWAQQGRVSVMASHRGAVHR